MGRGGEGTEEEGGETLVYKINEKKILQKIQAFGLAIQSCFSFPLRMTSGVEW